MKKRQSKILFLKNETWKLDLKEILCVVAWRIFILLYFCFEQEAIHISLQNMNFDAISNWTFYSLSLPINKFIYLEKFCRGLCLSNVAWEYFAPYFWYLLVFLLRPTWESYVDGSVKDFTLLHMVHYFNEKKEQHGHKARKRTLY